MCYENLKHKHLIIYKFLSQKKHRLKLFMVAMYSLLSLDYFVPRLYNTIVRYNNT